MRMTGRVGSWVRDRFTLFLVLASALHLLLIFGISFGVSLNPVPRLAETLDVVLVQWRSEEAPDEPDYLAQASQRGGGDTRERSRPSEAVSAQLPTPSEGADDRESIQQQAAPAGDDADSCGCANWRRTCGCAYRRGIGGPVWYAHRHRGGSQ